MKKIALILMMACCWISNAQAQDFISNLKNSVERSQGASGADVLYTIYLTPTNINTYYAKDFDKGDLIGGDEDPKAFELIKIVGEESEMLVINIERAAFLELEVKMVKGKQRYTYKFHY